MNYRYRNGNALLLTVVALALLSVAAFTFLVRPTPVDLATLQAREMAVLVDATFRWASDQHASSPSFPPPDQVLTVPLGELVNAGYLPPGLRSEDPGGAVYTSPTGTEYVALIRLDPDEPELLNVLVTETGQANLSRFSRSGYSLDPSGLHAYAASVAGLVARTYRIGSGVLSPGSLVIEGPVSPRISDLATFDASAFVSSSTMPRVALLAGFNSLGAIVPRPPPAPGQTVACRLASTCHPSEYQDAMFSPCSLLGVAEAQSLSTQAGVVSVIGYSVWQDARRYFCGGTCDELVSPVICNAFPVSHSCATPFMTGGLEFPPAGSAPGRVRLTPPGGGISLDAPIQATHHFQVSVDGTPQLDGICGSSSWVSNDQSQNSHFYTGHAAGAQPLRVCCRDL